MSRGTGLATSAMIALLAAASAGAQSRVQVFRAAGDVVVMRVESLPGDRLLLQGTRAGATWIAELADDGTIVRQREIDTSASIAVVKAAPDGGIILAGSASVGGNVDAFVGKLDASWRLEWATVHGTPDRYERVSDIAPVSDGGWMAVGTMSEGGMLLRLDSAGVVQFLRSCSTSRYRDPIQAMTALGVDRWLIGMTGSIRFTEESRIIVAELQANGSITRGAVVEAVAGGWFRGLLALPGGGAWIFGSGCDMFCPSRRDVVVHRTAGGGIDEVLPLHASLGGALGALTNLGDLILTAVESTGSMTSQQAIVELDGSGSVARSNALETGASEWFNAVVATPAGLLGVGATDGFDGASSSRTGWLVILDDDLLAPVACALDRPTSASPSSQPGSQSSTTVPSALWTTGITSAVPVTLLAGSLTSTIECSGAPLLPREVSPAGAVTPLLVKDHEVLTWEDGSFSGSDTFDVHRGDLLALRTRDYGACWQTTLAATTVTDPELPGDGNGFFYLVAGRNAVGLGPVGYDSFGAESVPPMRCP